MSETAAAASGAPAAATILHNPNCGTSRRVLATLREHGIEPRVVPYLQQPPTREALVALLARGGLRPRDVLRRKEKLCAELALDEADDAAVLAAMLAHPVLIERPIVETARGVRLCRPAERVEELL